MGKCTRCACSGYCAPNVFQAAAQKLGGGAALGCTNCGHHVNLHE